MSFKIMSEVFERSKTQGNARLVLLSLADTCSDEGVCFPSIKTIAKKANISEETTRKFLHAFEKIGLVEAEERFSPVGRRTSNTYKLNLNKVGDDELTKDVIYLAIPKSKHRTSDGMNQFTPSPPNPVHTIPPMNQFIPSIMNHHKEPSKERSCGFVANAPQTADDLFPNHPPTNQGIAARSSMDSRPNAMTVNMAAFKTKANRLLGRRDSTPWSAKEIAASKPHLNTPEEDWQLLAKYYANRGNEGFYTRTSMLTLLNNWAGEIDKARAKFPAQEEIDWANVKPNQ